MATLIIVRLSTKRSLAEKTAFDAVLVVIIGSMLARAINGSEAFFPTLGTGIRSGVIAPAFRCRRVLFTCFWVLGEGNTSGAGAEWQARAQKHVLEPHF